MENNQLLNYLKKYGSISEFEEKKIRELFKSSSVSKKDVLINSNSSCNKIFFVKSGLLRAAYINAQGKEVTRTIASENRFLTNLVSFKNFSENTETIECIKNGEILSISREDFEILMNFSQNLKCIYADILEECNVFLILHYRHLNNSDLKSKLNHLKNDFPHLIDSVNDRILSSFIGISRETLARNKYKIY